MLRGVRFRSTRRHHLLPLRVTAAIVSPPGVRLAGPGTQVRATDVVAGRLRVQERLTAEIADAVHEGLRAQGVLMLTVARGCAEARGKRAEGAGATAVAACGRYSEGAGRQEALRITRIPAGDRP